MKIQGKEIIADEGKYLHRIGQDCYFRRCTLLQNESESNFEEVNTILDNVEEDISLRKTTEEKVKNMFFTMSIPKVINTFSLSNNEALSVKTMYPYWSDKSVSVKQGERYQHNGLLWECIQDHITQLSWQPSIDSSSLWKVVVFNHEGTEQDPIPYTPPMELFNNKYYIQDKLKYKCIRDSGIALSYNLNELVGTYVELINGDI